MNLDTLKSKFTGEIILPTDETYEQARATLMRKGSPALVVRPKTNEDVATALKYAQSNALILSIRSGGHSGAGLSTNDGGLVIDLSAMNKVELVDTDTNRVRIGAGAQWGDVAKALQEHGLAISSGDTKTVGIGGLTLGGGIGWMVRKYGLALDNVVAAEVVLADGTTVEASATDHPDLFWALRGGGGNFGVVTSFEFIAHPIGKVFAGQIHYTLDNLEQLLKGWRDCMRTAPEELTTMFLIMPSFGGNPPAAIILCCYASNDKSAAMKAIDPLLHIGTITKNEFKEKDYAEVLEEAHPPQGVRVITNNAFAKDFSDAMVQTIAKLCQEKGNIILQIRSLGGAMNRVEKNATAFAHRDSEVLLVSPIFVPLTASEQDIKAANAYWEKILPFTSGAYSNFFSENTDEEISAAYPAETWQRLSTVKQTYDPQNVFNQNCNIKPAI